MYYMVQEHEVFFQGEQHRLAETINKMKLHYELLNQQIICQTVLSSQEHGNESKLQGKESTGQSGSIEGKIAVCRGKYKIAITSGCLKYEEITGRG